MVKTRLNLEPEVQEIFRSIDRGEDFLLSGGAGSGKTYSLVSVIQQLIIENPTNKIACITYTNSAVKEIEARINHKNLNVSTIHDFLWDNIKHFQKELKEAIISIANNKENKKISIDNINPIPDNFYHNLLKGIQYKEFVKLKEGIISHDELLIIANYLFKKYIKLSKIVKDKYKYIFIDEYQDTHKAVVEIFLTHFKQDQSKRKNIIGFFGDAMQAIYDDGIGNLDKYKQDETIIINEIFKKQNTRNPQCIINLANKLRTDGIIQEPSTIAKATNRINGRVKPGNILFLYFVQADINKLKNFLEKNYNWDFADLKETKELNLTHNLIADKAGFRILMDVYSKDPILNFRDKIKAYIKNNEITTDFSKNTFGEVVKILQDGKTGKNLAAVKLTSSMEVFIKNNKELYNYAESLNYSEFSQMYVDKSQLLDDKKQNQDDEDKKGSKRDKLIKHLFKIQTNIFLYQNKNYNEFLKLTDYRSKITSIESKRTLKKNIESLIEVADKTIEEVIQEAHEKGICRIDDKLIDFKEKKRYLYHRIKNIRFSEFQKLYKYLEGQTPFSTQHKTKGAEFNNVLVILDNGGWNLYNFEQMFLGTASHSVMERTQKIFYVCCTRAKENLAVFFHNPNKQVIDKAKEWFGKENVIDIGEIYETL